MNDDELDHVLCAPLATIADGGFSARVMTTIERPSESQRLLETAGLTVAAGFLLAVLSASGFSEWAGRLGYNIATSTPLAVAALTLAITWSFSRILAA